MKHLLSGVALAAVLAIAMPIWAQAPVTPSATAPLSTSSTAPPSRAASPAPAAASEKATAAPGASAGNWVQPKPRRHAHRVRRHARYGYYPYYGYYRWGSPTDHMARQLNAQQLYGGGWGGGGGPARRAPHVPT